MTVCRLLWSYGIFCFLTDLTNIPLELRSLVSLLPRDEGTIPDPVLSQTTLQTQFRPRGPIRWFQFQD